MSHLLWLLLLAGAGLAASPPPSQSPLILDFFTNKKKANKEFYENLLKFKKTCGLISSTFGFFKCSPAAQTYFKQVAVFNSKVFDKEQKDFARRIEEIDKALRSFVPWRLPWRRRITQLTKSEAREQLDKVLESTKSACGAQCDNIK